MDDISMKIGLTLAALVIGNLVTRWWDRSRPLGVLQRFSTATKGSHRANCSQELHDLTKASWAMHSVDVGDVKYREIELAHRAAEADLELTDEIDKWVADTRKALTEATEEPDIQNAVKMIFRWTGLRQYVEMMFYRSIVQTTRTYTGQPRLIAVPSDDKDGSITIVFDDSLGQLGHGLTKSKWKAEKIVPLVKAIQYLDKDLLLDVLSKIPAIALKQRDVQQQILKITTPIREDHTLWIAHCVLVNYGNSPVILWPTAKLLLREKRFQRPIPLPCLLAQEKADDATDASDLIGPIVLGPGSRVNLWAATKDTKSQMRNGNAVSAHFKDKTAKARVRFLMTQRGVPFKTSFRSTWLLFAEETTGKAAPTTPPTVQ